MAISRPLLIALAAAVLLAIGMTFMRIAGNSSAESPAPPKPAPEASLVKPKPAKPKAAKQRSAKPGPATPKPSSPPAKQSSGPAGLPGPVRRALAQRKVVVLFLYQPPAADDAETRKAMSVVRGAGIASFSSPIDRASRYRELLAGVGITQAPAVVIVDRQRRARLLEGFQDAGTLRQEVADAK